jgi:hypothetical protein
MLALGVALLLGIVIGLARGGALKRLEHVRLRHTPVVFGAVVLQIVATPLQHAARGWVAFWLVLASYAGVAVFAAANRREIGMPLIALGSISNLVVIAANRGMPVSVRALEAAGLDDPFGAKTNLLIRGAHRALTPHSHLRLLADIIPLKFSSVVSVGDLLIWAGLILLLQHLIVGPRGRHTASQQAADDTAARADA